MLLESGGLPEDDVVIGAGGSLEANKGALGDLGLEGAAWRSSSRFVEGVDLLQLRRAVRFVVLQALRDGVRPLTRGENVSALRDGSDSSLT